MTSAKRALLASVAISSLLGACSNGNDSSSTAGPPPPTTATPLQNQFGAAFQTLFGQQADSDEATEPPASVVPSVDSENEALVG